MQTTIAARLDSIQSKVLAGRRLSLEDGLFLYEPTTPLHEVGELANLVRERKNGNRAYYNVNTHLNPTNVCVYRCTFCAFRSDLREPEGLRDERRADPRPRAAKRSTAAAPRCTSSAACTTRCSTTGISTSSASCTRPIPSCT